MPRYYTNRAPEPVNGSRRSAYGEEVGVSNHPQFQHDFQYGVDSEYFESFTGTSGTVTETNSLAKLTCGTDVGGYGVIRSRRFLQFKPGASSMMRAAISFDTPTALSLQWVGLGSLENKLSIGYNGTNFGINRRTGGLAEIRTLTITAADGTDETPAVVLDGTTYNPTVGGVSTNGDAWDISDASYTGWRAEQVGATVTFQAESIGAKTNTYSYTGDSTGTGTWARTRAGAADGDNWLYQANFNLDRLDGTGPSGFTIDPQKLNVYQIRYQFGAMFFSVECLDTGRLIDFHRINYIGVSQDYPSLLNYSMQLEAICASAGSTTDLSVHCAFLSAFLQTGDKPHVGKPHAAGNVKAGVGTTETALFTIKPGDIYNDKINFAEAHPIGLSIASSSSGNKTGGVFVRRNATLGGTPDFNAVSSNSHVLVDYAGTTATGGELVGDYSLPSTGSLHIDLSPADMILSKTDAITVSAVADSGTIDFHASLDWTEDY